MQKFRTIWENLHVIDRWYSHKGIAYNGHWFRLPNVVYTHKIVDIIILVLLNETFGHTLVREEVWRAPPLDTRQPFPEMLPYTMPMTVPYRWHYV